MKRCTAVTTSHVRASTRAAQCQQRWNSYTKADLTPEALLSKVQAGLGPENTVDAEGKTIKTAVGGLPMSPLFDPAWLAARRRQRKAEPSAPSGRFRSKLANNPFARALETPTRQCAASRRLLPRYFLQDFEVVQHPETGAPWWAPGPLAFDFVDQHAAAGEPTSQQAKSRISTKQEGESISDPEEARTDDVAESETDQSENRRRRSRAPLASYTLSRKSLVDTIGSTNRKMSSSLLAARHGMALSPTMKTPVWRSDMGDVLLQVMRKHVVDALISRANRPVESVHKFLHPLGDEWDAVKTVKGRGCVLWLPSTPSNEQKPFATLDIEDVSYGSKMAVHNLVWLLSEDGVESLRDGAEMFRSNEVVVLKQWKSASMMRLHMLLWRMQGYLAVPDIEEGS